MRIKNLLGLAAIGGGIYWMQKKRGGDMTFSSIKENVLGLVDELKNKASNLKGDDDAQGNESLGGSRDVSQGASRGLGTTYTGSAGGYSGSGSGYGGSGSGGSSGSGYGGSGSTGGGFGGSGTGGSGGYGGGGFGGGGTRH